MSLRASGSDILLDVAEVTPSASRGVRGRERLDVDVHAGATVDLFPDGFDEWRDRVKASVKEPAVRGAANKALVGLVARFFGLGARDVEVERGATDSRKTLRLRGITLAHAKTLLEEALA